MICRNCKFAEKKRNRYYCTKDDEDYIIGAYNRSCEEYEDKQIDCDTCIWSIYFHKTLICDKGHINKSSCFNYVESKYRATLEPRITVPREKKC